MQTKNNLKKIMMLCVLAGVLAISGCAGSKKGNMGGSDVMDANGASSSGLGDSSSFGSEDGDSTRLMAPHNQTYHFEFDDSQIQGDDRASLEAQGKYLAAHPNAHVLLTGHTDERGSREYNIALGERRAISVLDFLRMSGVHANQIRTVSYGEEQPVANGHDESAYRMNRRVELIYEATE